MSWFQILILIGFASIIFALYDSVKVLHDLRLPSFWADINKVEHEKLSSISNVLDEIERHLFAIRHHVLFTESEDESGVESLKHDNIFEQAVLIQQHKANVKANEPLTEFRDRIGNPSMVKLMEEIRDRLQSIDENLKVVLKGPIK
jgi:hypothetical protein